MVDIKELMATVDSLCEESSYLAKDTARLVAGWQRVDKLTMDQIVQSLYHMSWNLKDLARSSKEVTGTVIEVGPSKIEDIRYPDHETLNRVILIERSKNWYLQTKRIYTMTREVLAVLDGLDARPWHMGFINSRVSLDLHFFRMQFERATGEKLED